ncbi:uncharacterized protein LOC127732946 [Mytilus californianus]|uniref:uncharacterized protein LOC127732946 n=1 Tax=Mytilus californianus TaxID=6549 RepID=UPI0022452FD0|nr:uncharacterized protein LOC127732946 [Mytilus californianus]XP_052098131.1 uncharacterized protein LOC127732946 [Mytilus californianus]
MGVSMSGPSGCTIKNGNGVLKCVPFTKYKPFPSCKKKSAGELIIAFKALPTATHTGSDNYWWINCQFVPNDDTTLMVTSSVYILRGGMSNVQVRNIPAGKVCKFSLESNGIRCELVKTTGSGTWPKLQVHPDSFYICYLDIHQVKFFHSITDSGISSKALDPHFRQYRSFALSPNGKQMCILARNGKTDYDLVIYGVNVYSHPDCTIQCSKINKDFRGTPTRTDLVDCKWSMDSRKVAISISTGYVMIIDITSKDIVCNIFPDILDDCSLSSVSAFDFDPRSCCQIMAVGTSDGYLHIVNIEDKDIICKSDCYKQDSIDVVMYTPEGNILVIALHSFSLHLYNSYTCDLVYTINMIDSCPELDSILSSGNYPFITSMDITRSGEQLATCCSDGYIRVWQLPPKLNLKFICKLRILSLVFQGDIKHLPLPHALKDYLLPFPMSS